MTDLVKRWRIYADPKVNGEGPIGIGNAMADRIEELETQLIEAEKYNRNHQQACLRIEQLEAENASLKRLVTDLKEDLSG